MNYFGLWSISLHLHSVCSTHSLFIHSSSADLSECLSSLQYHSNNIISSFCSLNLSLGVSIGLFPVSHASCYTAVRAFINCNPSLPRQFFIMCSPSASFISWCLVKNMLINSMSKFMCSIYLSFAFQWKYGYLREGPALYLVTSVASFCSVFVLFNLHSYLFIAQRP